MCLGLEIEVLEQLDSLILYMTYGQICIDIGVALILLCTFGLAWWVTVLALTGCARLMGSMRLWTKSFAWYLGLGVPFSYLILETFGAMRLVFFPYWHQTLLAWICIGLTFIVISLITVRLIGLRQLQEFCRTRLAPIAVLHVACAFLALIMLWSNGVYLFRDFARPGRTVADADLPDIYLITFDALRADDMSVYGYHRQTTPSLEKLARKSYVFDYFFANSNFTTPTTTSIETGELPWSHRLFQAGGFPSLKAQTETLASILRQRGYYTAMITSNYLAGPVHHKTLGSYDSVQYAAPQDASGPWLRFTNFVGTNTQYTLFTSLLKGLGGIRFYLGTLVWRDYPYPPGPVLDRARVLLERADIHQPRFVWTHIFPPHDPYLPPEAFRSFLKSNVLTKTSEFIGLRNTTLPPGISIGQLHDRYDEMISYGDHEVGEYLDWLDKTGRLDRSIVVVSADHGESFEHGWLLHTGPYLTDGLIHIPFLIHIPGQTQGKHISRAAEQADILPTILDLIGTGSPNWSDGISLRPELESRQIPDRFVYSMDLERNSIFKPVSKGVVAVIDDEFKYVCDLETRKESLYRYKTDPGEATDLIEAEPLVAKRLREALFSKLQQVNDKLAPN